MATICPMARVTLSEPGLMFSRGDVIAILVLVLCGGMGVELIVTAFHRLRDVPYEYPPITASEREREISSRRRIALLILGGWAVFVSTAVCVAAAAAPPTKHTANEYLIILIGAGVLFGVMGLIVGIAYMYSREVLKRRRTIN